MLLKLQTKPLLFYIQINKITNIAYISIIIYIGYKKLTLKNLKMDEFKELKKEYKVKIETLKKGLIDPKANFNNKLGLIGSDASKLNLIKEHLENYKSEFRFIVRQHKKNSFIVNEFLTILNFKRLGIFEFFSKFGQMVEYEKFTGIIENEQVKGFICLDDDNIYKLSKQ